MRNIVLFYIFSFITMPVFCSSLEDDTVVEQVVEDAVGENINFSYHQPKKYRKKLNIEGVKYRVIKKNTKRSLGYLSKEQPLVSIADIESTDDLEDIPINKKGHFSSKALDNLDRQEDISPSIGISNTLGNKNEPGIRKSFAAGYNNQVLGKTYPLATIKDNRVNRSVFGSGNVRYQEFKPINNIRPVVKREVSVGRAMNSLPMENQWQRQLYNQKTIYFKQDNLSRLNDYRYNHSH